MYKLSESIERKFTDSIDIDEWEIETDSGWQDITSIHKTIEYEEWEIETEDGYSLIAADTHILFDENFNEVFVKDLILNISYIRTKSGNSLVTKVINKGSSSHMYDISVDSKDHRFYSNDILSHNSTTIISYLLWCLLFKDNYSIALLANKGQLARDLLGKLRLAYEYIPDWLQQGVSVWNKGYLEFENGSKIIASSTSSSAIRGGAYNCVTGDTKIVICDDYNQIFNIDIKHADSSIYKYNKNLNHWSNYMYYTVYKITNIINGKEYHGYHHTNNLEDGYMGSGKLIKRAISKYGIENFKKEYIEIFDNRDEALSLEAFIVTDEYCARQDTYNLSCGGKVNPCLFGERNGFYGKKHSEEVRRILSEKGTGRNNFKDDDIIIDNVIYNSLAHAKNTLNLSYGRLKRKMLESGNGFISIHRQELLIEYIREIDENIKNNRLQSSIRMRKWAKGKVKSPETRARLSATLKGHKKTKEWSDKINKNPEKIRKTAEKHRGMKRSDEAKEKMSRAAKLRGSNNKGKYSCHNPITREIRFVNPGEIPEGWIRGNGKYKIKRNA